MAQGKASVLTRAIRSEKMYNNDKNREGIPVVWFKIVNGQFQFVAINPNVEIIMTRDEARKYK